jgi:hypothetical protein
VIVRNEVYKPIGQLEREYKGFCVFMDNITETPEFMTSGGRVLCKGKWMNDVLKEITPEILKELNFSGDGAYENFTGMYGGSFDLVITVDPRDED